MIKQVKLTAWCQPGSWLVAGEVGEMGIEEREQGVEIMWGVQRQDMEDGKGMIPRWKYWEGQSRKDQEKQLFGIWHRKSQKCRQFYEDSEVPTLAVTFLLSAALHSNFLCSSSPTKKGVNISHYVWNYLIGEKKWGVYAEKETQKNAFLTLNYLISMCCNLIFLWQSSFVTCNVHLEHTHSISV